MATNPTIIKLTDFEMFQGAMVGCQRNIKALKTGAEPRFDDGKALWNAHVEGACGEIAVAKATGLYWSGSINTYHSMADVSSFEVRTRSVDNGKLIVHDTDANDAAIVLVVGRAPVYRIVGWITGRDAKRQEWVENPNNFGPAYFVPQSALHPIETIFIPEPLELMSEAHQP